jgi:hypothetical protein
MNVLLAAGCPCPEGQDPSQRAVPSRGTRPRYRLIRSTLLQALARTVGSVLLGQRRGMAQDLRGSRARGHLRLRYDITDKKDAITLRRAGRLHHLRIGTAHARRRVLAIVDEREVTVVDLGTGEVLSNHLIEPDRGNWRNRRRDPGRWPGSQANR